MEALSSTWDGSESHAEAIAQIIRALGHLRKDNLGKHT